MLQRSYIRNNYIESEMEEKINMRNQYYNKNLPNPIALDDAVNKRYANSNYLKITDYDNSIIVRNNTNTNFNSNTFTGLDSIYVNRDPTYEHRISYKTIYR